MDMLKRKTLGKFKPQESRWNNDKFFKKSKHPKYSQKLDSTSKSNTFGSKNTETSNNFFITSKVDHQKQDTKPSVSNTIKKPFDKKKWRLQKYSNKYKLQQWEEKRKKTVLREYYREIKDDTPNKIDVQKIYAEDDEDDPTNAGKINEVENENNLNAEIIHEESDSTRNKYVHKRKKAYLNAQEEYQRIKEEKVKRREEFLKRKEERDKALKEYKEKKVEKYKKLNKKTKKGQPVMKHRMQLLLEEIQKSINE